MQNVRFADEMLVIGGTREGCHGRRILPFILSFVWGTRDREPLLVGDIEQFAYALMRQKCRENHCPLAAIGGMENHVHLLVTLPRTLCIPDFVRSVKGASAHLLNVTHGPPTWGFKWQGGYGVHTVSPGHFSTVRRYIENQKQHHAQSTLWPASEKFSETD
ncbi:MAG: IS200/IS605 family transposase [Janthinobacterium lividum]